MLDTKLEDLSRELALCLKCKMCTYGDWPENYPLCPPYFKNEFFTYSGGGMVYIARSLLMGLIDYSPAMAEILYQCTTCGNCDRICEVLPVSPPHKSVTDIIRLVRSQLVAKGQTGLPALAELGARLVEEHSLVGKRSSEHLADLTARGTRGPVLFAGCLTAQKRPTVLRDVDRILASADVEYQLMSDEWCCGAQAYDLGLWESLPSLAAHNVDALRALGAEQVIFLCPHCYRFFDKVYPSILNKDLNELRLMHVGEFLGELAREGRLNLRREVPLKVTYHDPCSLGRIAGQFEPSRDLLRQIRGLELVEMARNKMNSYCCGAGGGVKWAFPDFSRETAAQRLDDAVATGADTVASACPLCEWSLADAGGALKVANVTELIAYAID
ncbi:MAG: (Fe-S)-binding protein [Chloroflexi bacterium]|nr:(Fe-S)-binding protein [Chloroflexota bacterium]